jgi:hypothetical protein
MSISNNTHINFNNVAFSFLSFDENIYKISDVITSIIFFCRNPTLDKINNLTLINETKTPIKTFEIKWFNNYGLVNLENKWINNHFNYEFLNDFSKNYKDYKIYVHSLYINNSDLPILQKLPLLFDKIHININLTYIEDNNESFNAIEIIKYKSLTLKIFGLEYVRLADDDMIVYKQFINENYYLISSSNIDRKNKFTNYGDIELSTVQIF